MITIRFALLAMLPFLAASSTSREARAATCTSNTCTGTIIELSVFKTGSSVAALVRLDSNATPGCTLNGSDWEVLPTDDAIVRTLTAAHLAGKAVTLRPDNPTSGVCTVNYVTF